MTVAELKKQLEKYPTDMSIILTDDQGGIYEPSVLFMKSRDEFQRDPQAMLFIKDHGYIDQDNFLVVAMDF